LSSAQKKTLEVTYKKNNDKSYDFRYEKSVPGSFTIMVQFTNLTNARYASLPHVVKASGGLLFKLTPIDDTKGIGFSWKYRSYGAAIANRVDESFVYLLPFPDWTSLISQDASNVNQKYYGGEKSDSWQSYALTAEADSVLNMRKGVVVRVENDHAIDTESYFTTSTNKIVIEHKDRTRAVYKGFSQHGIVVKPGDIVYPHTYLGSLATSEKDKKGTLMLHVYYLTQLNLDFKIKESSLTDKDDNAYLKPMFFTENGPMQLQSGESYKGDSNLEIIQEEMSKREIKKMKKGEL